PESAASLGHAGEDRCVLGLVATHVELAHDAELDLVALAVAGWATSPRDPDRRTLRTRSRSEAKYGHGLGVPFDSPVGILLGEYTKAQAPLGTLRAVIAARVALCTTPSLLGGGAVDRTAQ